jgi:hypothetical protein
VATREDIHLATREDFFMATDSLTPGPPGQTAGVNSWLVVALLPPA